MYSGKFSCKICTKEFLTKTKLDHHIPTCTWLHVPRKTKEEETEKIESRLTDGQRDKMIRDIMYQMNQMQQKMNKMSLELTQLKTKQRIHILKYLNSPSQLSVLPKETINEWFQNIPISQQHLEQIFMYDFIAGLQLCISDHIHSSQFLKISLPLCAFTQKAKTIYIYENVSWSALDTTKMKKLMSILFSRFFQMFLQWEIEQDEYISTEEGQEKDMVYMKKMMDGQKENISRINKLFSWMYTLIQKEQCFVPLSFDEV
jgi:hypothetical protein